MSKEKKWEMLHKSKVESENLKVDDIIKILLENRGLTTKKQIDDFLHADITAVSAKSVGINRKQLIKTLSRIEKAIKDKEQIVVFGDYDVDGITGTAILWETLHALGAHVTPYIPNRIDEGYGLSQTGISNVKAQISNVKLIITVDNGIVANEAVDFAEKRKIDVIITDHHTPPAGGGKKLPEAFSIVHATKVCGAAVAYLLAQEIINSKKQIPNKFRIPKDHLALVALATVADLVPLTGANRILLRFGLLELRESIRPGLMELFREAKIESNNIDVYEIGHIIAPRLNAMGRLESAMDSLRLLCTKDKLRAKILADTLSRTNRERQLLTQFASAHAISAIRQQTTGNSKKLLFIAHDQYEEGIIGLVAGKLVEEFYVPAIVLSKGEKLSKASARSVHGFNIIEFIRTSTGLLVNAGGHPMAAGFTIETKNIPHLQKALEELAEKIIDEEMLTRILQIDCKIRLIIVTGSFYLKLQQLAPFGVGNPEPSFVSSGIVEDLRTVGAEKQHLKLRINGLDAIAFGMGDRVKEFKPGEKIDFVYSIAENKWNGKISLQLKVKDIK